MNLEGLGRLLLMMGAILLLAGLAVILLDKSGWPGKLPGDIVIRREGLTIYFPIVTFLLVSLALTIALNIVLRLLK